MTKGCPKKLFGTFQSFPKSPFFQNFQLQVDSKIFVGFLFQLENYFEVLLHFSEKLFQKFARREDDADFFGKNLSRCDFQLPAPFF